VSKKQWRKPEVKSIKAGAAEAKNPAFKDTGGTMS
jgi:hypothetical protein